MPAWSRISRVNSPRPLSLFEAPPPPLTTPLVVRAMNPGDPAATGAVMPSQRLRSTPGAAGLTVGAPATVPLRLCDRSVDAANNLAKRQLKDRRACACGLTKSAAKSPLRTRIAPRRVTHCPCHRGLNASFLFHNGQWPNPICGTPHVARSAELTHSPRLCRRFRGSNVHN